MSIALRRPVGGLVTASPSTLLVFPGHTWPVATTLDSTDMGHFHLYTQFYWTVLFHCMPF